MESRGLQSWTKKKDDGWSDGRNSYSVSEDFIFKKSSRDRSENYHSDQRGREEMAHKIADIVVTLKPRFMYALAGAFVISFLITALAGLKIGAFFACFAGFYLGLMIRKTGQWKGQTS